MCSEYSGEFNTFGELTSTIVILERYNSWYETDAFFSLAAGKGLRAGHPGYICCHHAYVSVAWTPQYNHYCPSVSLASHSEHNPWEAWPWTGFGFPGLPAVQLFLLETLPDPDSAPTSRYHCLGNLFYRGDRDKPAGWASQGKPGASQGERARV